MWIKWKGQRLGREEIASVKLEKGDDDQVMILVDDQVVGLVTADADCCLGLLLFVPERDDAAMRLDLEGHREAAVKQARERAKAEPEDCPACGGSGFWQDCGVSDNMDIDGGECLSCGGTGEKR